MAVRQVRLVHVQLAPKTVRHAALDGGGSLRVTLTRERVASEVEYLEAGQLPQIKGYWRFIRRFRAPADPQKSIVAAAGWSEPLPAEGEVWRKVEDGVAPSVTGVDVLSVVSVPPRAAKAKVAINSNEMVHKLRIG